MTDTDEITRLRAENERLRDEFYRRFSKSYDKLHQSEMRDDLVERVAFAVCVDAGTNHVCKIACVDCRKEARAALAVALEEAARVCDPKGDCSEMDTYGRSYAAAIRAMIPKENT